MFTHAPDHLSYDRTLFVPKDAYNVTSTTDDNSNEKHAENSNNAPTLSFTDQFVPPAQSSDPQHDSVIKPRKGVGLPPVEGPEAPNRTVASAGDHSHSGSTTTGEGMPKSTKRKIPVGMIFLYAAVILGVLALLAFLGQKFLDCWERRHYTRADYLLDGMYEDRDDIKSRCPSGH